MIPKIHTKTDYVNRRKQIYKNHCHREGKIINLRTWKELIAQWEFDYEMERRYEGITHFNEK